jgi:hypothetical protein
MNTPISVLVYDPAKRAFIWGGLCVERTTFELAVQDHVEVLGIDPEKAFSQVLRVATWVDATTWRVMCPFCPDWSEDELYPIGDDFFGEACRIGGVRCCETCYNVSFLTS